MSTHCKHFRFWYPLILTWRELLNASVFYVTIMPKRALFCNSPLRNNNIPIKDMQTHKALRSGLPMQWFVSHIAFRETVKDRFCSATKRYIVTYGCILKCQKALQTLALSNSRQVPSSLYCKDILARYEDREVVGAGTST